MLRFCILLLMAGLIGIPAYTQQKNIIFIISDDHRYDAMGFGLLA